MNLALLDRDGTLIYEPPGGLVRPEDFRVLPGVMTTLKELQANGYVLVMVTNQTFTVDPYPEECFRQTQRMLIDALAEEGIAFAEVFCCPHSIADDCDCRKPKTGMVDAFLREHDVDRQKSFVVGDRVKNDGGLAKNLDLPYWKMESNGAFPSFSDLLTLLKP